MKISIAVSILIFALAAGVYRHDEHRLASARERNARTVSQAAALGISLGSANQAKSVPSTKSKSESRDAAANYAVDAFISTVKEADAIEKRGGQVDREMASKIREWLASLSVVETEILVTGMLDGNDLNGECREVLISVSMLKLAKDRPQATFRLLPRLTGVFPDKEDDVKCREAVLNTSLTAWSRNNPKAATAWVRENGALFSESITESTKCGILSGAAALDPDLAFKLIGELGIADSNQAIVTIALAARTTKERIATLSALREHLAAFTDETSRRNISDRAVGLLAASSLKDGFDATHQWLSAAKLSPEESTSFMRVLSFPNVAGDTAKWIDWLEQNGLAETANQEIRTLVRDWTLADYKAAGEWLRSAPEGSGKNTAIQSFARTVAKYEPRVAAQWAMTLSAGEDRDATMREVYLNWPDTDAAAKEALRTSVGSSELE